MPSTSTEPAVDVPRGTLGTVCQHGASEEGSPRRYANSARHIGEWSGAAEFLDLTRRELVARTNLQPELGQRVTVPAAVSTGWFADQEVPFGLEKPDSALGRDRWASEGPRNNRPEVLAKRRRARQVFGTSVDDRHPGRDAEAPHRLAQERTPTRLRIDEDQLRLIDLARDHQARNSSATPEIEYRAISPRRDQLDESSSVSDVRVDPSRPQEPQRTALLEDGNEVTAQRHGWNCIDGSRRWPRPVPPAPGRDDALPSVSGRQGIVNRSRISPG